MSLLSDLQKNQANDLMDQLHELQARPVIIVNEIANASFIDPNTINPFEDKRNSNLTYTANQTTITARIKHLDKADSESSIIFASKGDGKAISTPIKQDYGIIRIKVKKQYENLVKNSTKIIVDGYDCQLLFNDTPQSIFDINFCVFYLSRQN